MGLEVGRRESPGSDLSGQLLRAQYGKGSLRPPRWQFCPSQASPLARKAGPRALEIAKFRAPCPCVRS